MSGARGVQLFPCWATDPCQVRKAEHWENIPSCGSYLPEHKILFLCHLHPTLDPPLPLKLLVLKHPQGSFPPLSAGLDGWQARSGLADLDLATHQQVTQETFAHHTEERKWWRTVGLPLIQVPPTPTCTCAGLAWLRGRRGSLCTVALELWREAALLPPLQPRLKTSPTQPLDRHAGQPVAMTLDLGGYCSSLM